MLFPGPAFETAIFLLNFCSTYFIFFARKSHRLLYYGLCNLHNAHPIRPHWTAVLNKSNNSNVRPHLNRSKSTAKVGHTGENNRVCTDYTRTRPDLLTVWFSTLAGRQHWPRTKCLNVDELLAVLMPKHTVRVQTHAISTEVRLRNTHRYRRHCINGSKHQNVLNIARHRKVERYVIHNRECRVDRLVAKSC